MATPREVFVSYAHEDQEHLEALEPHLASLVRKGAISVWHDGRILAGSRWEDEILDRLERADLLLLLVSSAFLDSDYVWGIELERALSREADGSAMVIPVIVRPTLWENTPIGSLQALPRGGKPITTWANRDEAWLDVAVGIDKRLAATST